jgi:hypothetical protein
LDDEVEVDVPGVAQPVVCVVLDAPGARVSSGPAVPALNPHVNVLDGRVAQVMVGRQFVEFGDHGFNASTAI